MNNDLLKTRIESFVQELDLLVRQSVLDALKSVLGTAGTSLSGKKRGRPAGSGKGPGRPRGRRPTDLGDALGKMVAHVKANDGQGIGAIADATGLDLKVAKKAALALIASGTLKKSGQKRGTVYHVGSGRAPRAKASKKAGRKA
jgi:hypothetical protein